MPATIGATPVTVRQLPAEEWERLRTLPFAANGLPDPDRCAVLIVENDKGEIVGLWSAMTAVHLEGLWIHEDYRLRPSIAGRLFESMKDLLRRLQIRHSFTVVQTMDVLILAHKAGFQRIPGDLCLLELDLTEKP